MKILTTASALLYGCATLKLTAAEDDGLQRRLLRGNPAPKGRSQPAERVSNMSGDDAEGAVGKASTAMLMGRPLESFLSDNVPFDDQKAAIIRMAGDSWNGGKKIVITEESAEDISSYLVSQVDAGLMGEDAARTVAMGLGARELYTTGPGENDIGAVEAVYNTYEGNMARVATSNTLNFYNVRDKKFYTGIWGYSTGDREYALQCHGYGIAIIDVTPNKTPPFTFYARRVQLIEMAGGEKLRDVVTYKSPSNGKTYAYVGAQNRDLARKDDPSGLWVIDLSYLSGDRPHSRDSDPIPEDAYKEISGYNGYTHTINAQRGLLFLHPYGTVYGCQVLDITNNPTEPKKLFTVGDGCHDSYVRENIEGKDILFVSDAINKGEKIYDITDVDANTSRAPPLLGITDTRIGMFDHSSWLSEDNRYLFVFDESSGSGGKGIVVYNVEDLTNPVEITRFKTSLAKDVDGTVPHNGMIRGGYLYVAYYGAGLRVFDITNPLQPVEVGKVETDRDPEGYGSHDSGFVPGIAGDGGGAGAWNTYFLPSGNILVSDTYNGLFVVQANRPYSKPRSPKPTAKRMDGDNEKVKLDWDAVPNARGYSVQRKRRTKDQWETIAEHLVETSYIDTYTANKRAYYRIDAINGEGVAFSKRKTVKRA